MKGVLLRHGFFSGLVKVILVIIPSLYISEIQNFTLFEEIEYLLLFLVSCTFIYLGVKKVRDQIQSGFMTYAQALLKGLFILLVSGVTYATIWTIFINISKNNPEEEYFERMIQDMKERGMSEEDIDDAYQMADWLMDRPVAKFFITIAEPIFYGILAPFLLAFFLMRKRGVNNLTEENISSP